MYLLTVSVGSRLSNRQHLPRKNIGIMALFGCSAFERGSRYWSMFRLWKAAKGEAFKGSLEEMKGCLVCQEVVEFFKDGSWDHEVLVRGGECVRYESPLCLNHTRLIEELQVHRIGYETVKTSVGRCLFCLYGVKVLPLIPKGILEKANGLCMDHRIQVMFHQPDCYHCSNYFVLNKLDHLERLEKRLKKAYDVKEKG